MTCFGEKTEKKPIRSIYPYEGTDDWEKFNQT